jgi:hypothetical protein
MVTKKNLVKKARFPVFDAHNHLGQDFGGGWDQCPSPKLSELIDQAGVVRSLDLDGGWVENLLIAPLGPF